jgi:nucleoside-diphosphate-sugar epimerase
MPRSIFVTGASGFIGQCLLRRLVSSPNFSVKALTRRPIPEPAYGDGRLRQIAGDLLDPQTYQAALAGCDTVVHLAAATGRAKPEEYKRVNVEGALALLQACKTAGVRRFLHVSTIAAGYADQRYYPYAQTKVDAERLVRESGIEFVIVRPTLVLGEKSPIWNTLIKIAKLPVVPLFEGARPVSVQPIHVDDVVRGLVLLLESDDFKDEVLELGGPQQLPFREFLELTQQAVRDKPSRLVGIPLAPVRAVLAAMEPFARSLMPVTAGQLAVFANDSVAGENWLQMRLQTEMSSTKDMIAALVDKVRPNADRGSNTPQVKREARSMSDQTKLTLQEECRSLAAYLLGVPPSPYIEEQYVKAIQIHGLAFDEDFSCFDRTTVRLARRGRLLARCADSYCALLHRRGVLRRKLIVLAAILEHVAPMSAAFDQVEARHVSLTVLSLATYGLVSAVLLLVGAAVLIPAKLLCLMATRSGLRARSAQ